MAAVLLGVLTFLALAPAPDAPQAILDRAITAMGGEEKLRQLGKCRYVSEAVQYAQGQKTAEQKERRLVRLPDCLRLEIEIATKGKPAMAIYTLAGSSGCMFLEGEYLDMPQRLLNALQDDMHCLRIQYLLEAKQPRYRLQTLRPKRVEGVLAVGVSVQGEGVPTINLYFDPTTGLLIKSEMHIQDVAAKHQVFQEIFLKDYREVAGMKYAARIVIYQDYSKYMETTITEVKPLETIRDSEFLRPG